MTSPDPTRRALLSAGAASLLVPAQASAQQKGQTLPGQPPIGLLANASETVIAHEVVQLETIGYSRVGHGAARYIYDPAIDRAYVSANSRSAFMSANGRGFRLAVDQQVTPFLFGAVGTSSYAANATDHASLTDDTAALQAFFTFCARNRVESANWGGAFGVTAGLVIGDTALGGGQFAFTDTAVFSGFLVLAVKSNIAGAVLTCNNRPQALYGPLAILGPDKGPAYAGRLFDVGLMIEQAAYMQTFSSIMVSHARLAGVYHSGRELGDQGFQNVIENGYYVFCGSGASEETYRNPAAFLSSGYSRAAGDVGDAASLNQRTILKVDVLPPELVDVAHPPRNAGGYNKLNLAVFAIVGGNLHQVREIDRRTGRISLFPWLPASAPAGPLRYVFGAGLVSVGGDAGMMQAKTASTGCAIGLLNHATYGGEHQGTFQSCVIAVVNGEHDVPTIGPSYNGYFESNTWDFIDNAGSGHFILTAEQALNLAKTLRLAPRHGDAAKSLVTHVKIRGTINKSGYWHYPEMLPDPGMGAAFARIGFDAHNHLILPMVGDRADIRLDANSAQTFAYLFGYRARTIQVVGSNASGAPAEIRIQLQHYDFGVGEFVGDAKRRINGGTPGAPAVFTGFTGPVLMQMSLDPSDPTNIAVQFFTGLVSRAAPQADSNAINVAALAGDFNSLLAKLRAAGVLAS